MEGLQRFSRRIFLSGCICTVFAKSIFFPQITMLFEIKYCLPDLQQQLTAFMAHLGTQKIIIALQTSYKDTSSHRGTRWLEMSLQNNFKSNYFHGFLKKWRRNAEGFCMDQCRVITLVSDCNSLGRIVGYAKGVSQL